MTHQLRLMFALVLLTSATVTAFAQNSATTGALAGTVKDAAGAVIAGAAVTLRDVTTNQTRQVTTAADGSYRASALPVGTYEIRVRCGIML